MQTSIKFNKFKHEDLPTQIKMLAGAAAFEMQKVPLAMKMAGRSVLSMNPNIKGLDKVDAPTFERIKAFLGKELLGNKYATSDDNTVLNDVSNEFEQFYHTNMPEMDMAWTLLFDFVDLRGSTHDHFDIINTNAGLTWEQRKPGQLAKVRRNISEAKTTVSALEFVDGLGILDQWLRYQQFWNIDEAIAEFRSTAFDKQAGLHYGLLTALGSGVNTAFATDDVQTANNAASTIIRNVRSSGYPSDNPTFYAVCEVEQVGRLERMLTAQRGSAIVDAGTVSQPLAHRIGGIIGTSHIPSGSSGWYLVMPGRKLKRGSWKDLTVEDARNAYASATDLVGSMEFNGAIGDSNQVRRCLYS